MLYLLQDYYDNGIYTNDVEVMKFDLLKFDHSLVRHDPEKIKKALEQII